MLKFTIKESKKNPYDSVIEVKGHTIDVTINELLKHIDYCRKQLKESSMQLQVNTAQNYICEAALPLLKKIPKDKIDLALIYLQRKQQESSLLDLKATSEKTIATYDQQLKQIERDLGIEMPVATDVEAVK